MKSEHIKQLLDFANSEYEEVISSGFRYFLDENLKGITIKDVFCYEIESMYPTIFSLLHENKLIQLPEIGEVNLFLKNKNYLRENNKAEYERLKIISNSLYTKLHFSTEHKSYNQLLLKYAEILYQDLIKSYQEDLIFINVDRIITRKEIILDSNFNYQKYNFDYFLMMNEFHYIYLHEGKIKTNNKSKLLEERYQEFYKKFRLSIREDRLKQLLHEKSNI